VFVNRANAWLKKGELDRAIADYDDAIRLEPKNAEDYRFRGIAWAKMDNQDKAIVDLDEAIRLDPRDSSAYRWRGRAYVYKGDNERALADYNEAARLIPNDAWTQDARAWLLATIPDEKLRDGKKAVEAARKACELSEEKVASYLDTLAAAYAETGDFDQAVEWERKAMDLTEPDGRRDRGLRRTPVPLSRKEALSPALRSERPILRDSQSVDRQARPLGEQPSHSFPRVTVGTSFLRVQGVGKPL